MTIPLLDRLRSDHANFERVLARLDVETQRLAPHFDGEADLGLVLDIVDYLHNYADRWHHPCEDILYSHLLDRGDVDVVVGDVLRQHRKLKDLSRNLFQLVGTVLDGRIPNHNLIARLGEFTSLQRRHLRFENRHLFPFAERRLTPNEWHSVERSAPLPEDPVFGSGADHEQRLFAYIMASRDAADSVLRMKTADAHDL